MKASPTLPIFLSENAYVALLSRGPVNLHPIFRFRALRHFKGFLGAPGIELSSHASGSKLTQRLAESDRRGEERERIK